MEKHHQTNGRAKLVHEFVALFDRLEKLMDELRAADNKILDQMQASCDEAKNYHDKMKLAMKYIEDLFKK